MEFEWDENKRQDVIRERGVDVLYAALMFENPVLVRTDDRADYGEDRFIALGHVGEEFFYLVFTPRGQKHRLITAWKAGRHGEKHYQNGISGSSEGNEGSG